MAVASLVTCIAQGYNGTYTSTDTFSATPETLYANKAGMAIGTLLSLRNPVKAVKQLGTEALQAGTLNTVTKGASSQFAKVERWFCKTTTGPTSIKTLEKTTQIAIEREVISTTNKISKNRSFFQGTSLSSKVKNQMTSGDFHLFLNIVENFEKNGIITQIRGGDGIFRTKLEIPGEYNGRIGFFEFIKEPNGTINHRFFRPTNN